MKTLRQILFLTAMVIGLSFSVIAQKDDQKPRPPKEKPPTVDPGKKPPRGNPPKDPKKPEASYYVANPRNDEIA